MLARTSIAIALLLGTGLELGLPHASQSITECEFIKRTMNKLGRNMSINRSLIASRPSKEIEQKASEELAQQTKDYRLAKRQYEKAGCKSKWD